MTTTLRALLACLLALIVGYSAFLAVRAWVSQDERRDRAAAARLVDSFEPPKTWSDYWPCPDGRCFQSSSSPSKVAAGLRSEFIRDGFVVEPPSLRENHSTIASLGEAKVMLGVSHILPSSEESKSVCMNSDNMARCILDLSDETKIEIYLLD